MLMLDVRMMVEMKIAATFCFYIAYIDLCLSVFVIKDIKFNNVVLYSTGH